MLLALIIVLTWFAWPRVPIITAFAAKGMCSSVFLADKTPERVHAEDLSFFPISLAKCQVNYEEKSVTARVLGLGKRKAVFREGLGAVIVLDKPEEELKAASYQIPDPGYSQDTILWPMGDMMPETLPGGVDYEKLHSILEEAIDAPGAEPFKKTLGLAVVYNNELIGENYLEGYDAWTRFHSWSMTKSVTGALTGALVKEGRIDITAPTGIPEWDNDERKNITVENILHMSSGLFVASSYSYGTTRDWARFGMLFLNRGIFQGDTIVTPDWVEYMTTAAPASGGSYAATFWLREPDPENALIDVPGDIFFADGFLGQRVYVIPSKKLVVVRMGYSLGNFSVNDFLREIIATLP